MNQFGDLYIGKKYAVYAPDSSVRQTDNDLIEFKNGSYVNLHTGDFFNTAPEKSTLTVVKLKSGENHFSFGSYNENPTVKKWYSKKISVQYDGAVEIIPGPQGEVTIEENHYCEAQLNNEEVVIIRQIRVTEVTYIHKQSKNISFTQSSMGNKTKDELPTLRIHAGNDITVEGKVNFLKFQEIDAANISCRIIVGERANTLNIKSIGPVVLSCPIVLSLTINTMGHINTGQVQSNLLNLYTNGEINFSEALACKNVTLETMGPISLSNLICETATLKSNSRIKIENGLISSSLKIIESMGAVEINLTEVPSIEIKTMGEVKLTVAKDRTSSNINTMGPVTLNLDIAEVTTVKTMGEVNISAKIYIQDPSVKTMGKKNVLVVK